MKKPLKKIKMSARMKLENMSPSLQNCFRHGKEKNAYCPYIVGLVVASIVGLEIAFWYRTHTAEQNALPLGTLPTKFVNSMSFTYLLITIAITFACVGIMIKGMSMSETPMAQAVTDPAHEASAPHEASLSHDGGYLRDNAKLKDWSW